MRRLRLLACALLAAPLASQTSLVPPGTLPNTGTCNALPFNQPDVRYQALVTKADLNGTPGLICGFSVAPCGSGVRSMATIRVRMAHHSGATMSTTFDANLNSPGPAVTVLDSVNFKWNMTANVWNDIDLQDPFLYNGNDNLVVEVLVTGTSGAAANARREGTNQRVYQVAYTGQPTGSSDIAAFKMRFLMGDASRGVFGAGCTGSNGVPAFSFTGTAQLGTVLGLDCVNVPPNAPTMLLLGASSKLPAFPLDLTPLGANGCTLYHDIAVGIPVTADASGRASARAQIPQDRSLLCAWLYSSYVAIDLAANPAGITTSSYGRALLGN